LRHWPPGTNKSTFVPLFFAFEALGRRFLFVWGQWSPPARGMALVTIEAERER
jgi:hypothetical protein